jgi:hypothetical protein
MATQILTIIGSILAIAIGLWKYFGHKNAEKRKQLEQAEKDLEDAKKNNDVSAITAAISRINRLR